MEQHMRRSKARPPNKQALENVTLITKQGIQSLAEIADFYVATVNSLEVVPTTKSQTQLIYRVSGWRTKDVGAAESGGE